MNIIIMVWSVDIILYHFVSKDNLSSQIIIFLKICLAALAASVDAGGRRIVPRKNIQIIITFPNPDLKLPNLRLPQPPSLRYILTTFLFICGRY